MIVSKHVRLVFVPLAFFLCTFVASCGGGGGGGGGGDGGGDGGGQTLNEYAFSLGFLTDDPLRLSAAVGSATLEELAGPIAGAYTLDTETISLNGGPMVKVTTDLWNAPLGILSINVDEPIESIEGDNPTQGKITVGVGINPFAYTFSVTITPTGVRLEREGFVSVEYTWDEFDELLGSGAPDWQQQASFASSIIGFYFNQVKFVINAITLIEENDTALSKGNVTINGDTFLGTPPAGHDAQGTLTLSCTNGNVGPGGDFSEVFNDYLVDDPSDDIDQLYDGSVRLDGFVENSDEARDIITSIGFPVVLFGSEDHPEEGLTIYETEETSPGVFSINDADTLTITGGYSIQFSEPSS